MTTMQSLLTLLLFSIVTAASGPAAVAHKVLSVSLSNTQENFLNGVSEIIRPGPEAAQEHLNPSLSMTQEAARTVLPSPLWNIIFEELPELLFESDGNFETWAESQVRRVLINKGRWKGY